MQVQIDDALQSVTCCESTVSLARSPSCSLEPGPGTVEFQVDEIGLQPGMYYVSATIVHTAR